MLEADVEKSLVQVIKALKGHAYKFTSPGRRGVPDRLVMLPIPEEHREIVAKYVKFVECKKPGGQPRPEQWAEINYIRSLGYEVSVLDRKLKKGEQF